MGAARRALLALIALTGIVVVAPAAPAAPAASSDPTRSGPLRTTRIEYDAGPALLVADAANGAPQPVDLRGEVHLPAGRGPFPVVVLMHGRHSTCTYATVEFLGHPCPNVAPVVTPVDSFTGYTYLATNLASHGYLVVSVDANGINTYDTGALDAGALARAQLISRTLDLLGEWNAGPGPGAVGTSLVGKVDLRRLGLMGHSRGGEGVTRWLAYNRDRTDGPRYRASAVFSLAPTDFRDHRVTDGTPYAVLLPRCDGDVADLQGADVFERSQYVAEGPLHQVTVNGANHNWFNSVWVFDDFGETGDIACGSASEFTKRLTIAQQERVGLAWMAAFFRRYVGGDKRFDPMLTGRGSRDVQCSRRMNLRCVDVADVSYDPGPTKRTTLAVPESEVRVQSAGLLTARSRDRVELSWCDPWQSEPCPAQGRSTPSRSKGAQLTVRWTAPAVLTLTASRPWRGDPRGDVVVRLGMNADEAEYELGTRRLALRVRVADTAGRAATVRVTPQLGAPQPVPGDRVRNLVLSDVRVPLRMFTGVDVTSLRTLDLLLDDAHGDLQVADVALHSA